MAKMVPKSLPCNLSTLFFFFFFVVVSFFFPIHAGYRTHHEVHTFLMNLKRHWNNPPSLSHWTASNASHCYWPEIQCQLDYTVTGLMLNGMNIPGTVPPFICELETLLDIDLSYNKFSGQFPTVLYNCSNLLSIDLTNNYFHGPIPDDIGRLSTGLEALSLSFNNFTGHIPAAIGQFPKLQSLSVARNLFDTFPPEVGNLSALQVLELGFNVYVPSRILLRITRLQKLEYLIMGEMNLIGEIPDAIGDMKSLRFLHLAMNKLTGKIPERLFLLKNLQHVLLYYNCLYGEIPQTIRSLGLVEIDLAGNDLTGPIPKDFGKLKKLKGLNLYENQLSGEIPASIGRLPKLIEFSVFMNNLSGRLPPEFGRYSRLEMFQVSDNRLTGRLPEFLCAAHRLVGLVAFHNNLTGGLPKSLGNCKSLAGIQVYGNGFSGTIPAGLWSSPTSNITTMLISNNLFVGNLPKRLSRKLSRLEMSNNRFSGEIPAEFPSQENLKVFMASDNLFVGSIPRKLTVLPLLGTLLLDGNKLSGQLPPQIISWKSLTMLNLSRNELTGPIPADLGSLPTLTYLDLSENQFSGQIPAALGNKKLAILNLSSNNLSGPIPAGIENPVYLSSFLNNPSLCANTPSLNHSLCHHATIRKPHQVSRWFVALCIGAAAFALAIVILISMIGIHLWRKQRPDPTWKFKSFHKVNFTESEILSNLTENNVIGSGGSGKVYRAAMNRYGGDLVAIKKISTTTKFGKKFEREFLAEVEILSTIRHTNIVKLLCCAYGNHAKLIVYEYLKNRSLDLWLHGSREATVSSPASVQLGVLDWPKRLHIAVGAAHGLSYMHHHCSPPIIHRDVKSSNILLDSEFNTKIADFGLARLLKKQGEVNTMSAVQGSLGYMAPECAQTVRVNEKIDVYGFGVVLLELATGREAGDGGEHSSLVEYAQCHIQQGRPIPEALDKEIEEAHYLDEMSSVFKLGILCTRAAPQTRPSMREVVQVLLRCSQPLAYGEKVAFHEGSSAMQSTTGLQTEGC